MATLGDAVTLDDWREVVARAVSDAKAGDQGARNWLAKYLIGTDPPTLLRIAAEEWGSKAADNIVSELGCELAEEDERRMLQQCDWDDD
jgi:hypothetical protein